MKYKIMNLLFLLLPVVCQAEIDVDIISYLKREKRHIDFILATYEIEGATHKCDFNYHIGYLSGKYDAYHEILKQLEFDQALP